MNNLRSSVCWIGARSASKGALLALLLCNVAVSEEASPTTPRYPEHQDLAYYLRDDGTRVPIRTPADWEKRRAHILAGMEQVMGPLPHPKTPVPLDVQTLEERKEDGYIRRKIEYHTNDPKQTVRAWLLLPTPTGKGAGGEGASKLPRPLGESRGEGALKHPAVVCLHQTNVRGKDSPAGLFERPQVHYGKELAQRGYVTIAPDYPSFGEAKDYDFDTDDYVSGSMKAIYDNMRAIDLLESLPEVDAGRIGCIGHSLGGHNTLFTAAFDPRIKAAVTSCGFTSFHKYYGGNLKGWTQKRYMPLIATKFHSSPDEMPFDFPEVLAAIAPRAVFVVAPLHDANFDITGVRECLTAARPIFKLLGRPDDLQAVHPDTAHEFPDAERIQSYEFLDRILKSRIQ